MIISKRKKFIFLKTRKTAGTTIEIELSQLLEDDAIVTPFGRPEKGHVPRNYRGLWNPMSELLDCAVPIRKTIGDLLRLRRFYNHMPAALVRHRIGKKFWNEAFKVCVERDFVEKTVSHINMEIFLGRCQSKEDYFARGSFCLNSEIYTIGEKIAVDKVLDFRSLAAEMKHLAERIGLKRPPLLKTRAKGSIEKRVTSLSRAELEVLREVFSKEITLLDSFRASEADGSQSKVMPAQSEIDGAIILREER